MIESERRLVDTVISKRHTTETLNATSILVTARAPITSSWHEKENTTQREIERHATSVMVCHTFRQTPGGMISCKKWRCLLSSAPSNYLRAKTSNFLIDSKKVYLTIQFLNESNYILDICER